MGEQRLDWETWRRDCKSQDAGFALMAGLAVHDKAAVDRAFVKLLPLVEHGAFDDRNFVKKAVNWALRNIGKRNRALNIAAVACARRILAADAIRELTSEKVQARLAGSLARRKD